jgi:hypothetical protein
MRGVLLLLVVVSVAPEARAQEDESAKPEWPDPGSEDPGGPRMFPAEPTNERYDESADVELEVPESLAEPTYRYSWYGWRNVIGDGAAIALLASFFATELQIAPLFIASGVTYAIGGPIAHFTAGNWGRALISFGMRVVGPGLVALAFFGVKCAADDSCNDESTGIAVALGAIVGAVVAAGLDDGLVAREKIQVEAKVAFAPALGSASGGSKTLGLAVQF